MSDQIRNPEDRFSHNEAQIILLVVVNVIMKVYPALWVVAFVNNSVTQVVVLMISGGA